MPPHTQEDPTVYRWRQTVFVGMLLLFTGVGSLGALSYGLIPVLDTGFARQKDFGDLLNQFKENRTETLDDKLTQAMERYCDIDKQPLARRYAMEKIQSMMREYSKLTNAVYNLPSCDQLR